LRVRSAFFPLALIATASCVRSSPTPSPLASTAALAGCYRLDMGPFDRAGARTLGGSPAYVRLDTIAAHTPGGEHRLRAEWLPRGPRPAPPESAAPAPDREAAHLRAQLESLGRALQYWRPVALGDSVELVRGRAEIRNVYRLAVRRDAAGDVKLAGTVALYSDDGPRDAESWAPVGGQRVECPAATPSQ
jgi:hypothetical protein